MKIIILLFFMFFCSWSVLADKASYSIQIAASQSPNLTDYSELSAFGLIYADKIEGSYTRVKIGSYSNRAEAEKALKGIRGKGFTDAFISLYTKPEMAIPTKPEPEVTPKVSNKIVPINKTARKSRTATVSKFKWSKLTAEQKRNVVYLNGVLHLRVNDDFIPLTNH